MMCVCLLPSFSFRVTSIPKVFSSKSSSCSNCKLSLFESSRTEEYKSRISFSEFKSTFFSTFVFSESRSDVSSLSSGGSKRGVPGRDSETWSSAGAINVLATELKYLN